ncbi:MAG TPA: HAD family phosphatase [Anaerolineales bacterium]
MPVIIWDMGGVIVRTEDRLPRTQLAGRFGMTYEEIEKLIFGGLSSKEATLGRIPAGQHWENVCSVLHLPLDEIPVLKKGFWGGDRVDMELVEYIRLLRPRYSMAVLSNAWSDLRASMQNQWGIADAFDEIIISAEVGVAKPDPRIYQIAIKRLNVAPSEAVFVDDFLKNVEAARATGLYGIQFMSPVQVRSDLEQLLD